MQFPERPTCHADGWPTPSSDLVWRPPTPDRPPYGNPYRTCSYCGSLHPEDLLNAIKAGGIKLDLADLKYGWPHKFYVEGIPNPLAGQQVKCGSNADGSPMMGPAPAEAFAKFYNDHLLDEGYDEEAKAALFAAIRLLGGVRFEACERDGKPAIRWCLEPRGRSP